MPGSPTFTLPPILMSSLEIKNGQTITGTIDATGIAGSSQTILLFSDTVGITVDTSVTVSPGSPIATITVTCAGVEVGSIVSITAHYYCSTQKVNLIVAPASLGGVSFDKTSVQGGHTTVLTVTLDSTDNIDGVTVFLFDYAPPGGYTHMFTDLPSYIIVAPASLTGSCTVTTRPVNRNVYGSVRAVYGGSSSTASIFITT